MFSTPAFAQTTGAAAPSGFAALLGTPLPMMVVVVAIFYILVWRPQQKRMKDQRALLEDAKKGDVVVTGGGLIGKITRVDGDEVEIELAANVRVRAVKSSLSDVRPAGGAKPAND